MNLRCSHADFTENLWRTLLNTLIDAFENNQKTGKTRCLWIIVQDIITVENILAEKEDTLILNIILILSIGFALLAKNIGNQNNSYEVTINAFQVKKIDEIRNVIFGLRYGKPSSALSTRWNPNILGKILLK